MARLQRRRISEPTEVRQVPRGTFNLFDLDDTSVGYTVFQPSWRWSESVKAVAAPFAFADRGVHEIKGLENPRPVYALVPRSAV